MDEKMSGPPRRIGVLMDWSFGSYQNLLFKGLADAANRYGVTCIFFEGGALDSPHIFERQRNYIYQLASLQTVDGLIVLAALLGHFTGSKRVAEFLENYKGLPLLTVSQPLPGIPSVLADNETGFKELLDHLIVAHGFKNLAFVKGPTTHLEANLRFDVFMQTLKRHHLTLNEKMIFQGDFTMEAGVAAANYFVDNFGPKLEVIVCANDTMAFGVVERLKELGLTVPGAIAVTGIDDLELCRHSDPPLTTVRLPVYQLGFRAVELTLDLLEGKRIAEQNLIPSWAVFRESCGCSMLSRQVADESDFPELEKELKASDRNTIIFSQLIEICKKEQDQGDLESETIQELQNRVVAELTADLDFYGFQKISRWLWNYCWAKESTPAPPSKKELEKAFRMLLFLARRMAGNEWRRIQELLQENMSIDLVRELFYAGGVEQQLEVIAQRLIDLGMDTFYLSCFREPNTKDSPESICLLGFRHRQRLNATSTGIVFPTLRLVPDDYLQEPEPKLLLVEPLKEFGFIVYKVEANRGRLFAFISDIIAGAVDSAQMIAQIEYQKNRLSKNLEQLRRAMAGFIQTMSLTIEMRDPYTAGHQRRVSDLARRIAQEMDLPAFQVESIRMAGIIHDLGKIYVPAEILNRAGPLSEIEYRLVKNHPQVAYDILKNIEFPWPLAEIIFQHHERLNGSGYPRGLVGNAIWLEARILAVADVVEAMSSHRPYRVALGIEVALAEIEQFKGILYDPQVVEVCISLFRAKGYQLKN